MRFKDYYAVLGVAPTATADEIKSAYRKLARRWHPDVNASPEATAKSAEINEANEVLGDAAKRATYDRARAAGYRPGDEIGEGFTPPPPRDDERAAPRGGFDQQAYADLFEALFGAQRAAQGGGRRWRRRAGEDIEHPLVVSLEEAYRGAQRTIVMEREDGQRTLEVRIPPGVTEGSRVRVRGEGGAGAERSGDLYLVIQLAPHAVFRARGRDLEADVAVAPWIAALGGAVPAPTPGGEVELRVPPGSRDGSRLRLRGRGLPGEPPGDQYVVLRIAMPAQADARQREAWAALAQAYGDGGASGARG